MSVYTYATIDEPLATGGTQALGINDFGQIVGGYTGASGIHGFLYSGGTYVTLDDPLATGRNDAPYPG
jgi:probable HAF family extracellular repeat protein